MGSVGRLFLPPDIYLRHWIIARELKDWKSTKDEELAVLDVGGGSLDISCFGVDAKVKTANVVGKADILFDGKKLPVENGSFDVVVSVDTLEHVEPKNRVRFVEELLRVAKRKLILIAPYASKKHIRLEQSLKRKLEREEKEIPDYLMEHIKYGLVNSKQINAMKKIPGKVKVELLSNVVVDKVNYLVHNFEVRNGKINRLIFYLKYVWNLVENILTPILVDFSSKESASRVLLVVKMKDKK